MLVDERIQAFSSGYCKGKLLVFGLLTWTLNFNIIILDLFHNLKLLNQGRTQGTTQSVGNIDHLVVALGDLLQPEIDILRRYAHLVDCLFINADGIYLATYSALLLTMKLIYLGYYNQQMLQGKNVEQSKENAENALNRMVDVALPLTEAQFIDEIFNYNTTIYLSPHFLAEIYQSILVENFFSFLMVKTENALNTSTCAGGIALTTTSTMTTSFEKIPLIKLLHGKCALHNFKIAF